MIRVSKSKGVISLGIISMLSITPFFIEFPGFVMSVLFFVLFWTVLSASWNILAGFAGYYNFGASAFSGLGAFLTGVLVTHLGWSRFFCFLAAGPIAAAIALIVGYPCLRLKGVYFAFGTVSLNYIFMYLIMLIPGTGGAEGILLPYVNMPPHLFELIHYETILALAVIAIILTIWISNSKFGLGLRGIRWDEDGAEALGLNVSNLKITAFMISSFFLGAAGAVYGSYMYFIAPAEVFSPIFSFTAMATALLGGLGSVFGPVAGSLIYALLEQNLRYLVPGVEGLWRVIVTLAILAIVLYEPIGLAGLVQRWRKSLTRYSQHI